ncbi:MAG: PatB family C-S lyase [Verrucomicrobiales bacterium]|nr:PatB family C-S lyase [Verrucomicrobiales bacterium]
MNAELSPEFDEAPDRTDSGSLKWQRYAGRDVLPMWVADMDFCVPAPVLEALHHRVDHKILGYSVPHAGVVEAVVEYLFREHGVEVDPSWLVFTPGMVPALAQTSAAVGREGDAVLVCTPVYPPFLKVNRDTDRSLITVPLREMPGPSLHYTIDFDALEAAVTPRTRLFILCSPHNPVGRVFSREEMEDIAEFCIRHDLILCSDEIHADLLLEPDISPHTSAVSLSGEIRQRTITLLAASKTYNIPGLACAFAVIPNPELRRRFVAAKNCFVAEVNPLGYHATEAAYKFGKPWLDRLRAYLRGNRDLIASFVSDRLPHIRVPHLQATYLAWLDVRSLNLDAPVAHFEQHGLGLSNGADFGAPGFVRLNFGCSRARLHTALERFASACRAAQTL